METKANFVLIGAFTLAGFLGLMAFFLWLARVELDRQFAYYDVIFPSVSGLSNAAEVRFAGLPVGRVIEVALDPDRTGRVRVRIEVQADTPVRVSSVATIESLGVTGVTFLAITAGNPEDPFLSDVSDDLVPDIPSRRSPLQSITEDAEEVLDEILEASRGLSAVLAPDNRDRIATILENAEAASENLDRALQGFSETAERISAAAEDMAGFADGLDEMVASATATLGSIDIAATQVTELAQRTEQTLDNGDAALESVRSGFDAATAFIADDIARLSSSLEGNLAALESEIASVGAEARMTLGEVREAGALAAERLVEMEPTISAASEAFSNISDASISVGSAAESIGTLAREDGPAFVADARAVLRSADEAMSLVLALVQEDLPVIVSDIRGAAAQAAAAVDAVGANLTSASERTDEIVQSAADTIDVVADTFGAANDTLERFSETLEIGDRALGAAEDAFLSADRVVDEDVEAIVQSLREALASIEIALDAVTEDLPAITQDLRETSAAANAAFEQIRAGAAGITPPLRTFAVQGLAQYTRFAHEARELVANLERLVRQIERDPARYFLGRQQPAYRR